MATEYWAAILGSGVLVMGGLLGWLISWLRGEAKEAADEAALSKAHAHRNEVELLEFKAKAASDLRIVEVTFLEYKIHVSDTYVKRGDHTAILAEIFRKLETLDSKLDSKLGEIGNKMDKKQDKTQGPGG